jgi:hypothetical protein
MELAASRNSLFYDIPKVRSLSTSKVTKEGGQLVENGRVGDQKFRRELEAPMLLLLLLLLLFPGGKSSLAGTTPIRRKTESGAAVDRTSPAKPGETPQGLDSSTIQLLVFSSCNVFSGWPAHWPWILL